MRERGAFTGRAVIRETELSVVQRSNAHTTSRLSLPGKDYVMSQSVKRRTPTEPGCSCVCCFL